MTKRKMWFFVASIIFHGNQQTTLRDIDGIIIIRIISHIANQSYLQRRSDRVLNTVFAHAHWVSPEIVRRLRKLWKVRMRCLGLATWRARLSDDNYDCNKLPGQFDKAVSGLIAQIETVVAATLSMFKLSKTNLVTDWYQPGCNTYWADTVRWSV